MGARDITCTVTRLGVLACWVAGGLLWVGCGTDSDIDQAHEFTSSEFNFQLSIPSTLSNAGWIIVPAAHSTATHVYVPPDSSTFEAVAVVAPPGYTFPVLAPFFVDVFRLKNPEMTAAELAELREAQVGGQLLSRLSDVESPVTSETLVHGLGDDLIYEVLYVGGGLGYSINTRGAPDTSLTAHSFVVDSRALQDIASTFRFSN